MPRIPSLLAGFACQAATWKSLVVGMGHPINSVFLVAQTADGCDYPFSDSLNHLLLEDELSVWRLIAASAQANTGQPLPDVANIVKHVVQTVGTAAFGRPRLPNGLALARPRQHSWRCSGHASSHCLVYVALCQKE
ncbi:MAG: hypothetical protein LBU05_03970 [Bifidobacteriaceae bacterium]|jgi:hypothetical protein|nr:hypothetical protein [Bifidobacteriaceae bacterium]